MPARGRVLTGPAAPGPVGQTPAGATPPGPRGPTARARILTRGRGAVLAFGGALLVVLVGGFGRSALLPWAAPALLALPWLPARRLALGLIVDLPLALAAAALALVAGRLLSQRPLRSAAALLGATYALEALGSALVSADMRLYADPLVATGRVLVLGAGYLATALAFGFRFRSPARAATPEPAPPEPAPPGRADRGGDRGAEG